MFARFSPTGRCPTGRGVKKIILKSDRMFLTAICPKLPMRDKAVTRNFYVNRLGFREFGSADFDGYLMVEKDNIQLHFFGFKDLDPAENYG